MSMHDNKTTRVARGVQLECRMLTYTLSCLIACLFRTPCESGLIRQYYPYRLCILR